MHRRAAELSCLYWTRLYRPTIRGRPFEVHAPWVGLYEDQHPQIAVKKAAQVMVSEWAINKALWAADTQVGQRGNILYVFPDQGHLGQFTRARVDPAVEESPYLTERLREPVPGQGRARATDNVGIKRVGKGFIYFRGANSEAGLLSVDADLVIYDEVDRIPESALALGSKRLGSSYYGRQLFLSTPTYPQVGIDQFWLRSDRRHWHLKCSACNHWQYLKFPENVREDGEIVCAKCSRPLDRLSREGEWVAEIQHAHGGADIHGYHVGKLISPRASVTDLAKLGHKILRREVTSESTILEFYNQDLGEAYAPKGGQLTEEDLRACVDDYTMSTWSPGAGTCYMGVDVGKLLHVRIDEKPKDGKGPSRAVYIGTVLDFADLDHLMRRFDVRMCVIDGNPEGHEARKFQQRFQGRVRLCYYPNTKDWAHKESSVWKEDEPVVLAHRTIVMDQTFAQIRERGIRLPSEALSISEYVSQMRAPIRILELDTRGIMVAKYVEGGKADHYAHASVYCWLAANHRAPGQNVFDLYQRTATGDMPRRPAIDSTRPKMPGFFSPQLPRREPKADAFPSSNPSSDH